MKSLSREILDLIEELEGAYKDMFNSKIFRVWKNPDKKELMTVINDSEYKAIKFIADKRDETVYIWKGEHNDHMDTQRKLSLHGDIMLMGDLELKGSKLSVISMDIRPSGKFDSKEWLWVNKYLPNIPIKVKKL